MLISRIAPTPSGFLHIGNLANFYFTWKTIRQRNGQLHLRIDDCDSTRARPEYIEDIFRTLDWIGIDYDKGPSGPDDFQKHYSQTLKRNRYQEVLQQLSDTFVCDCSRSQLIKGKPYPGHCREAKKKFSPGQNAIRLKAEAQAIGDFIVWRKDDLPAYQLVSVVDDVDMEINLVVRGKDLIPTTKAQQHLAIKSGLSQFSKIQFIHHPMLTDPQGKKLSKSNHALSVKTMREQGVERNSIMDQLEQFLEDNKI